MFSWRLGLFQTAKQSVFSSKSVKKSVKRGVRVLRARTAREKKLFSLVPHLLFDCSRVLEYAKKRTVFAVQGYFYEFNCPCKVKNIFFPSRADYLRIVDDDRTLGRYCGRKLRGKVVLVNGNYALITFHSGRSRRYRGFQLTILFTENGMFK